ncbi:serine/threonine protein kinase [Trichophyton rubrum]|uniref:non-specific serine/threonine protein kinase n=1 Tax=Trichophyton rubrum TaxID=5551 RepID=A0A178F5S9_TRIRU|nr:hypothetical protein HL42_3415 [Trichophyton rubrum]OAL66797.1 serine/threonine protein kinase [Trichophyton rubrum]
MPGLNFTYEYFCDFVPVLSRDSSSPTNTSNLNPLIHRVLTHYTGSTIYGVGGHSVFISISEDLALKVSYRAGGEHIRHEQSIFKLLQAEPCPYIAHSYFSAPDIIFMELVKNGTLYDRMGQKDKPRLIIKWMQQLCEAAVALENIGYAHGDINPRNILFDDQENVRLVDFDHALKVGEKVEVGEEPLELYSDIDGAEQVNRLSRCTFPEVDSEDPIDAIISDCWQAKFDSMAALEKRVRLVTFEKSIEEKKGVCQHYYDSLGSALDDTE